MSTAEPQVTAAHGTGHLRLWPRYWPTLAAAAARAGR
jgi:hypothetical protein